MAISVETLRPISVFNGLHDEARVALAEAMQPRVLSAGAWLNSANDSFPRLGVVMAGALDVFATRSEDGAAEGLIPAGGSYGVWTLLGAGTRSGELRAAFGFATTTIGELDIEEFDEIVKRHTGVRDLLLRNAVAELRDLELTRAIRSGWGITDASTVASIARIAIIRDVPAGEILVRKGDLATSAYLVLSGSFRAEAHVGDAKSVVDAAAATLGPGHLIGERALLDHATRAATLTAMRVSRVAEFEAEAFQAMCMAHPKVLLRTVGELMRRHDSTVRPEVSKGH